MELNFARKVISHSTFGGGAHICAGMHLARIPKFRLEEGFKMVAHSGVVVTFERLNLE